MKDFAKVFGFFFTNHRKETLWAVSLVILAGLAEAIGIAAFLPFFQLVLESDTGSSVSEGLIQNLIIQSGLTINFLTVGVFIVTAIGLKAIILFFALRKVSKTVAKISSDLRARLLNALLNAKWGFFVNHNLGVSLNAIVTETFNASVAFMSAARFISAVVQFSIYAIGALLLSWEMFLSAIIIGGILAAALWFLVRIARQAGTSQMELSKKMLSHMADILQGIKPLRAMGLEGKFMTLLTKHSKGLEKAQSDQLISSQSMRVFHEPLMVITAIIGMYGAVTYANMSASELAVMAVIFIRLLSSMNAVQSEYQRLMTYDATLWSLMDTIEKTEKSAENWGGKQSPPKTIHSLKLENINFNHDKNQILKDVNLNIAPYNMTALIGKSGSGKTTIIDLISGFYKPGSGKIKLNNQELDDFDLKLWRQNIGFVPQEVFLFNDTVAENILMGRDYKDEEIWNALDAVDAREFVENMQGQLNASVGEGGRRLSGGQRQRIAIARAMLSKPQILLLDEATSALDNETERILLKTLRALSKKVTIIFISHNKVVQDYADKVYLLENGCIIE